MNPVPNPPRLNVINDPGYRENYANSVQVRTNLWDIFLSFGTISQNSADQVDIHNFQGVFLSPQQAKALLNLLQTNMAQYEAAFGEIRLEPQMSGPGGSVQ